MKAVKDDIREKLVGFNETTRHGNIILLEGVKDHFFLVGRYGDCDSPDLIKDHMLINMYFD
jgi:hypothetical protein